MTEKVVDSKVTKRGRSAKMRSIYMEMKLVIKHNERIGENTG